MCLGWAVGFAVRRAAKRCNGALSELAFTKSTAEAGERDPHDSVLTCPAGEGQSITPS